MNDTDYRNYVTLAKKELKAIEGHQIRICEYAMKVCQIRHGGRSDNYYTVTDFAQDIGMVSKTLQNWMLTYRNVVMKLDKPISTKKEWEAAKKVENILREERVITNRINEKPTGSKYAQSLPAPAEKVQSIFGKVLDNYERPFESEFAQILRASKHSLHLLQKRELGIIKDEQLAYLMGILDNASDLINNYLTLKKKNKGRVA